MTHPGVIAARHAFKVRNKYGARRTNGYASKRESEYADELRIRQLATNGDVLYWFEQVRITLSIGKLTVDFLIVKRDGSFKLVEIKGRETRDFKLRMIALKNERPELWDVLEVLS